MYDLWRPHTCTEIPFIQCGPCLGIITPFKVLFLLPVVMIVKEKERRLSLRNKRPLADIYTALGIVKNIINGLCS